MFNRNKKIKLYAISSCPLEASEEDFLQNLCTFVADKKDIARYVCNRVIFDNKDHYKRWLECHDETDSQETREKYVDLMIASDPDFLPIYTIREYVYDADILASAFRMFYKCAPVGSPYEKDYEIASYNEFLEAIKEMTKDINDQINNKIKV